MGVRTWVLHCRDCDMDFWKRFEHMDSDDIRKFVNKTQCEYCESDHWYFTDKTRFAGGRIMNGERILVKCGECYEEHFFTISGQTPDSLNKLVKEWTCSNCDSNNIKISDAIEKIYSN